MAKNLLNLVVFLLILLFLAKVQIISAESLPTYVNSNCSRISNNATVASLNERHTFLADVFINISNSYVSSDYYEPPTPVKFFNRTAGEDPNKVYILFQCRGDLSVKCWDCYQYAIEKILQCTNYDEAVVWYEECMLRYAYRNIFSLNETDPSQIFYWSGYQVSEDDYPIIAPAMAKLIAAAALGTNGSHFAKTETNLIGYDKLYGLAQCTPDIDVSECKSCLEAALSLMIDCCNASIGVTAFLPSCQLKYDEAPILGDEDSLGSDNTTELNPGIVIAIVSAASIVGFVLLVYCLRLCRRRKMSSKGLSDHMPQEATQGFRNGDMDEITSLESLQFDFWEVKAATSNFSEKNKLGQGGFGELYKGKLPNGHQIAVKRLSKNSQQGTVEFKNEVLLVAKLQHRNLVKLLGFCILRQEKILIYEFLSNSSLDRFLYDPIKRASLGWELRFRIITGVARGLLYLHEDSRLKIIHRDLKSSNILLDEGMNAKIADFGLAKLFDLDQTQGDTMRIAGTFGYMAPEYAMAGQFSVKSDVYSFGVIVLEIVSGQRNSFFHRQSNDEGLIQRAWKLWNEDTALRLVDSELRDTFSEKEVKLGIQIGLLCIQEDAAHRPRMASVVAGLNGQSITLPLPNAPHFFTLSAVTTDATSSNHNSMSGNEIQQRMSDNSSGTHPGTMSITELCPR